MYFTSSISPSINFLTQEFKSQFDFGLSDLSN